MFAKLFFKFIMIPALIVGGFGYVMYTRTGKIPFIDNGWFELSSSANQSTKELRNIISNKSNTGSSGKQTFYKWQDKNGQWHYGSKAPEEVQAKSITYDPNRNTVQMDLFPTNILENIHISIILRIYMLKPETV